MGSENEDCVALIDYFPTQFGHAAKGVAPYIAVKRVKFSRDLQLS